MSDNILDTLRKLSKQTVTIGIHGAEGEQKKIVRTISASADLKDVKSKLKSAGVKIIGKLERHRTSNTLTVGQVAYWMETGTKTKKGLVKAPKRSFIRETFLINKDNIIKFTKKVLKNNPENFYELTGQYVLGLIQKRISDGINPPNKPSTIKWKGSSKPLVDFGQMRNSLTYKINDV